MFKRIPSIPTYKRQDIYCSIANFSDSERNVDNVCIFLKNQYGWEITEELRNFLEEIL